MAANTPITPLVRGVVQLQYRTLSLLLYYFHATSLAGSVSESYLLVDESLSLNVQPNGYFHATYSAGSDSERLSSTNQLLSLTLTLPLRPWSTETLSVQPGYFRLLSCYSC